MDTNKSGCRALLSFVNSNEKQHGCYHFEEGKQVFPKQCNIIIQISKDCTLLYILVKTCFICQVRDARGERQR